MISVSFFSVKEDIENVIKKINSTTADYIHVDIADNTFVNNASLEYEKIYYPLKTSLKKKDIHLMVSDIKKYVDLYKELNPEFITFHLESNNNIEEIINYIKSFNIKVGIALNPDTNIDLIKPYLNKIDLVLIMSVNPGYGGQKFIEDILDKIDILYEYKKDYNFKIEVDGGINKNNINYLNKADIIVVGSYITNSDNYQEKINEIRNF